jgi:hypothetical protein
VFELFALNDHALTINGALGLHAVNSPFLHFISTVKCQYLLSFQVGYRVNFYDFLKVAKDESVKLLLGSINSFINFLSFSAKI